MVMSRFDFASDRANNDFYLNADGTVAEVTNAEAVGQHGRHRLQTFSGEWFLDTTCGVPWLSDILGRKYDPALAESVVKAELLDTDGVTEAKDFSIAFDRSTRGLLIRSITVGTEYEEDATV